ncbi:hypothetical protein SGLAM104S_00601 [Streptomyces glaucescens]
MRREAVLAVVGICALSDALLIALGVGGVGPVVVAWPGALTAIGWIGGVSCSATAPWPPAGCCGRGRRA